MSYGFPKKNLIMAIFQMNQYFDILQGHLYMIGVQLKIFATYLIAFCFSRFYYIHPSTKLFFQGMGEVLMYSLRINTVWIEY